jgi:hypothetical protein
MKIFLFTTETRSSKFISGGTCGTDLEEFITVPVSTFQIIPDPD